MVRDLNIDIICATSAEAKGRLERANGTLQDRLIKGMRLRGLNDPAAAEAFLPEFMADDNARFAKAPRVAYDAHRRCDPRRSSRRASRFKNTARSVAS